MKIFLCALLTAILLQGAAFSQTEEADDGKKSVWSSIDLQLYGYIKLDAIYNSALSNTGNFMRWVEYSPENPDDGCFHMTANQTRVGLNLRGPEEDGIEVGGRIEIDFYGGGAENKPRPMLRHAFAVITWPKSKWELIAGQTSDLISPLVPNTVNYSVAWWAGNVGYRRPQLRLTKAVSISEASEFRAALALVRDIGSTSSSFVAADSGTDAGVPGVQGRLGWLIGSRPAGKIGIGLSGHWAKEEFDTSEQGDSEIFSSWSVNLDYRHPLTAKVVLQAEIFTGENLASYLGGVGQGVNLDRLTEIGSTGAWLSLDLGPFDRLTYHLGISVDDPEDEDLEEEDRSLNTAIWWNGVYSFNSHLEMALELSYWATDYFERDTADSYRGQFAVIYKF